MKTGRRLRRLRSGANLTRSLTLRQLRREIQSLPICLTKSSREQERTEADRLSRSSSNGRTSHTQLAVEELEVGEAREVVTALVLLKVDTEAEVLATQRVDVVAEAVGEALEEDEVSSVAEVDVVVEAHSAKEKDHQHPPKRNPLPAIPERALLEPVLRCLLPKVHLPSTSSLMVTWL